MHLHTSLLRAATALVAAVCVVTPSLAWAAPVQDDYESYDEYRQSPTRVARVSALDGRASLRQGGNDVWEDLEQNIPISDGDEIYTADGSRLELQLGGRRYLRLDERTDVYIARLDPDGVRVEIPVGSAIVSLQSLDSNDSFEISAPSAAVTLRERGVYRVDVDDSGNTHVAVLDGWAQVNGTQRAVDLQNGEAAGFSFDDPYDVQMLAAYRSDGFDAWSRDLDVLYARYETQSRPVDSIIDRTDIYGLAELATYGSWYNDNNYGYCWRPNVDDNWQPFYNGFWQYYPRYGYTWVSNERWGWAPYHYGRWIYGNGWSWVPWDRYSGGSYSYFPANVYFYQQPGYDGYAWVPLAPNEPYIDYRPLARRHQYPHYSPIHLRNGRGIGLASLPGSDARLRPIRVGQAIKDRNPVPVYPGKPDRIVPVKPRFDVGKAEGVRLKPIVVRGPVKEGGPRQPAGDKPVMDRRPVKTAVEAPPDRIRVKPRKPVVGEVPVRPEPIDRGSPVVKPERPRKPIYDAPSQPAEPVRPVKPRREPIAPIVREPVPAEPVRPVEKPRPPRREPVEPTQPVERPKPPRDERPERPKPPAQPVERPKPPAQPVERPKPPREERPPRSEPVRPVEQPKPRREPDAQPKQPSEKPAPREPAENPGGGKGKGKNGAL